MPVCTHRGCEKTYDEATNSDTACTFHPQGPIFHEGLKGWSCCSKRVISFDQFLAIPGCSIGRHTDAPREEFAPAPAAATADSDGKSAPAPKKVESNGTEVYGTTTPAAAPVVAAPAPTPVVAPAAPVVEEEEEDDLLVPVPVGKTCKRLGCGKTFVSEAESRGDNVTCQYHPGTPIFHEGSKGWSCCPRKVLEFDEFLKLKGCRTTNQHLFVGAAKKADVEELVQCRHDWYQTQTHVILSIFAKKVIKESATVEFKEREVNIDLRMPEGKRFKLTLPLFQPIEPAGSSFEVLGTKVEITMKKGNGISWATLEPSEGAKCWTTFGTTGGAGTVGSKVMHLATDSPLYAQK
ncbi:hypothetical protein BGZ94_007082 [Podila epigama]|nr:hypothetical protein BGZ94_007082 [Podila epigama]